MSLRNFSSLLLLSKVALALPAALQGRSAPATLVDGLYVVDGVGSFTNTATFTFEGSSLPSGLYVSQYTVDDAAPAPYYHQFTADDVTVSGGFLNLKVPGGQTTSPIRSAEVATTFSNIKYASVRTTAILSDPPGTCNGMFFYKSDTQELDIEFLSDPTSKSNPGDGSRPLHYTNQDANGDGQKTYTTGPSPADATSALHEYRIDWTASADGGIVGYYLDGVLQKQYEGLAQDVPNQAGSWVWNNWANGDPGWTGAPPAQDSIFKIKEIVMYYNTA